MPIPSSIAPIAASQASTLIAHNRLEPRPRSQEFNRSLRAEVRDAVWVLARQWQLKEFRAEDRGSPALVELVVTSTEPTQLRLGTEEPTDFNPNLPWETQLQAQAPIIDAGTRLRMGQTWVQLLRENGLLSYAAIFRTEYPLLATEESLSSTYDLAYAQAQTAQEVQALLQALGPQVDGFTLFKSLLNDADSAVTVAGVQADAATQAILRQLSGRFTTTYERLLFGQARPSAWSVADLSHQVAIALPQENTPTILEARSLVDDEVQWFSLNQGSVDVHPALGDAPGSPSEHTLRTMPAEIKFIGAPNSRWWKFEDHRVDFGQVTGDSSDFGRMLLQEFVFLYQNDWFSVPISLPLGSLSTVSSLVVTDVFGLQYRVHAAGASSLKEAGPLPEPERKSVDHDAGRWSLFGQSMSGNRTAEAPKLLLPHTAMSPLRGRPVEQVTFAREEATNMVWAIEQTVPNGFGAGMDGAGAAASVAEYLRTRATPAPAAATSYRYRLASSIPEQWIPFLPRLGTTGAAFLEQGEMLRQVEGLELAAVDRTVQPRTSLLRFGAASEPYLIHDYQIPPVGIQLEGTYRRARGLHGQIALWYAYGRRPARRSGSSGLLFDQLQPGSE